MSWADFPANRIARERRVVPQVGGIDFGFHNPFAAVWGHLDRDDVLWITGMRYVRSCTIPVHAAAMPAGVRWWCDPANPDQIQQLRDQGHTEAIACVHRPVRGATGEMRKPIMSGIDMVAERMRTGRLAIVRGPCQPLLRELSMYCYDIERQQEGPVPEDDHASDALRYLIVGLDRNRGPRKDLLEAAAARVLAETRERAYAERQARIDADSRAQADIDDERWWR